MISIRSSLVHVGTLLLHAVTPTTIIIWQGFSSHQLDGPGRGSTRSMRCASHPYAVVPERSYLPGFVFLYIHVSERRSWCSNEKSFKRKTYLSCKKKERKKKESLILSVSNWVLFVFDYLPLTSMSNSSFVCWQPRRLWCSKLPVPTCRSSLYLPYQSPLQLRVGRGSSLESATCGLHPREEKVQIPIGCSFKPCVTQII